MQPLAPLAPETDGDQASQEVPFRSVPKHTHYTWARTFSCVADVYVQPQSLAEIERVVNLAHRYRKRVVTVGCGHSPSNIALTSSWLVNLDKYNKILSLDPKTGVVVMQSGIRLYTLCEELERHGWAMPNLGSINQQSIAGAISTGTHGSSVQHGLMSEDVLSLKITLANGTTQTCSRDENSDLFQAALLSLGSLGIISEITFQAVPAFDLRWKQTIDTDLKVFNSWSKDLWTQSEFVRVWWFPYTRRAVVWQADQTDEEHREPPVSYYDGALGYYVYHNLLYLAQSFPRILPWVEWFVFGMQYGFANGSTTSAVQPSRKALLMNCLYSQFVNEWAIPLHKGPEALRRLSSWLNQLSPSDPDYVPHNIPFSAEGLYVHAPVEVRVSDTTLTSNARPLLDPTVKDGPTLYLNATLYRPYLHDPPCRERYYEAFEWLMKDMGGRPHWAKNFETHRPDIELMYGDDLGKFRQIRDAVDPQGMFLGPWHRARILAEDAQYELEEVEVQRTTSIKDGITVFGKVRT
ncbi:L-gulonolactone/D-arabinono-1,4-lactone oxidase [Trichoderma aethiopicum]